METKTFKNFDASTVALEGSNLIEASAGTGKTYSIGLLALRLLLEKEIKIQEILMVTFTKAAVAELEERIRLFVRLAYKVSQGETIKDTTITNLVKSVKDKSAEQIEELLKEAVLFLDETSVLTIHSFCQQTLNEFAFETKQLFGIDLMQNSSAILEDETNKFWRKHATCIPTELLSLFLKHGLTKDTVKKMAGNHLGVQTYIHYRADEDYCFSEDAYREIAEELQKQKAIIVEQTENLHEYVSVNKSRLIDLCEGNTYARKGMLTLVENPEDFLNAVENSKTKIYVSKLFPDILEQQVILNAAIEEQSEKIKQIVTRVNCNGIKQIAAGVNSYKSRYNQITFDDLITKLHQALCERPSEKLQECLQHKYKAVFVDEFQDTDRLQFEIFKKAFINTILFYIGDPKQSIYAWRKADVFTYFKAKDSVDHLYGMNRNFRSSERLIEAMNIFFQPTAEFDTFHFGDDEQRIDYIPVASPEKNKKGNLYEDGQPTVPIQIFECARKDDVFDSLTAQIITILDEKHYKIDVNGIQRGVLPHDIGILVRTNREGVKIKKSLSRYGIPAITIDDGKVLQSEEAISLLYMLQAIADISRASINKALLSPFTRFKEDNILALNHELVVELFRTYKVSWEKDGVYAAIKMWMNDFSIEQKLLHEENPDGERLITNLYQLIEILHKTQSRKNLNSMELISWLKRGIEGMETEGDEFEQRIENDEEAIKIVTIHKSKGLEYKIVFAPTLDMNAKTKFPDLSFRTDDLGYVSANKCELTDEQIAEAAKQAEQENRRLIYVAVTRAVSQCFVYRVDSSYYNSSSLSFFTNELKDIDVPESIEFINGDSLDIPTGYFYKPASSKEIQTPDREVSFHLSHANWQRISYSRLRPDHAITPRLKSQLMSDDYDNFIFDQLKRGAKTGNMLHFIFENIHFHDPSKWQEIIQLSLSRFFPQQKELYAPMLQHLLRNVLETKLTIGEEQFRLADVNSYKSIHELEFDFNVADFSPKDLIQLSTDDISVDANPLPTLEGVMNGKIDLFFEHNGKYYVLDWKSNFLGDSVSYYAEAGLNQAMNENNYHLQYLIYSLAVKKYLESRIPNFNYETEFGGIIYLFVRGMRSGSNTGIFTAKPSMETIMDLDGKLTSSLV